MAEWWFNEGSYIGVDGTHPVVRAHAHHITVKEVEAHNGKRETQTQELEKFQEERREQQVTLLRKPSPVTAPFFQRVFQRIGKEWVSPVDKSTLEIADIKATPAHRNS